MSTIHLEPLQSEGLFYCFTCGECFLVNIWSTNYRKYPYKSPRFTLFTFDNKKQKILGNKRLPALLVFTVCYFKLMSYPSPPEAGSLFPQQKRGCITRCSPSQLLEPAMGIEPATYWLRINIFLSLYIFLYLIISWFYLTLYNISLASGILIK